jgi:hypothetical protein
MLPSRYASAIGEQINRGDTEQPILRSKAGQAIKVGSDPQAIAITP